MDPNAVVGGRCWPPIRRAGRSSSTPPVPHFSLSAQKHPRPRRAVTGPLLCISVSHPRTAPPVGCQAPLFFDLGPLTSPGDVLIHVRGGGGGVT